MRYRGVKLQIGEASFVLGDLYSYKEKELEQIYFVMLLDNERFCMSDSTLP